MALAIKNEERSHIEKELFQLLDEGINDLESGNTVSHEEAMEAVREKISQYGV